MIAALALALAAAAVPSALTVDPEAGNNSFSAVFDAPLGERINAVSSQVSCALTYDEKAATASGTCSSALTSVMVDNEPTKTEHFQQWATNKKSEPKACKLEARLEGVKLTPALAAGVPAKISGGAVFTVCGKTREHGKAEKLEGEAIFLPAGKYGEAPTVRIRARVPGFDRDAYQIGPKYTDGWLSRVQQLAPVVAEKGEISLSLFAKGAPSPAAPTQKKE